VVRFSYIYSSNDMKKLSGLTTRVFLFPFQSNAHGRLLVWKHFFRFACVFVLLFFGLSSISTYSENTENPIKEKVSLIYNFVRYTNWPRESQQARTDTFKITVVGNEQQYFDQLQQYLNEKQVANRKFTIQQTLDLKNKSLIESHIVIFNTLDIMTIREGLRKLRAYPVLTISDYPGFNAMGGDIEFTKDDVNSIRFNINHVPARHKKIKIRSPMLQAAANIVEEQ
jgi:hypothetical protein